MKLGAVQRTSLIDFPGEIAAVYFTQGCNFRCPYCHNPELVDSDLFETPLNIDKEINFLKKRAGLLDGVVITGGEPTIHKDLPDFLTQIKNLGYKIKLDTNGTDPVMIRRVLDRGLVDYIAMDYKAPLVKYADIVRSAVDVNAIAESVEIIKQSGVNYEFRTTVVEQLLSSADVETIKSEIGSGEKYCIQEFNPSKTLDKNFLKYSRFSPQFLAQLKQTKHDYFKDEIIR